MKVTIDLSDDVYRAVKVEAARSDRSIREYCRDIWNVNPEPIRLLTPAEVKAGFLQ